MKSVLPNSKISEEFLLSYLLLNKSKSEIIFDRVSSDMFYYNDYKNIYEVICELKKKNIEINQKLPPSYIERFRLPFVL